jgi:hypothetical protein
MLPCIPAINFRMAHFNPLLTELTVYSQPSAFLCLSHSDG